MGGRELDGGMRDEGREGCREVGREGRDGLEGTCAHCVCVRIRLCSRVFAASTQI